MGNHLVTEYLKELYEVNQNFEVFHVNDLKPGQVIFENVFVESRCLLTKGHLLTERIIAILKNRNLKQIKIKKVEPDSIEFDLNKLTEENPFQQTGTLLEEIEMQSFDVNATLKVNNTELLNLNFLTILGTLSSEIRYGKALNRFEDIEILKQLFAQYLDDPKIHKKLSDLKNEDENSYMHSVDVFILGTLFALSEGVTNIKDVALGYLLHDIDETYIEEFQILQLIDTYSVMTIAHAHQEATSSINAIEKIFNQITAFDVHLVYRFIDFLGIYPENSVVLLSDGTHAFVEEVDPLYPLLPSIKRIQTHETINIPMNFHLKIVKLLSYYVNTPDEMFSKFSDFLMNNDARSMIRYYEKLKEYYSENEWFTHIYLPIFSIYRVLEINHILPIKRIKATRKLLLSLLDNTLRQFRLQHHTNEKMIILFDGETPEPIIRVFEGLLHSNRLYPFIAPKGQTKEALEKMIAICNAKQVIFVGKLLNHPQFPSIDYYHFTESQLEGMLSRYMYSDIQQLQIEHEIERYQLNVSKQAVAYDSHLFTNELNELFI